MDKSKRATAAAAAEDDVLDTTSTSAASSSSPTLASRGGSPTMSPVEPCSASGLGRDDTATAHHSSGDHPSYSTREYVDSVNHNHNNNNNNNSKTINNNSNSNSNSKDGHNLQNEEGATVLASMAGSNSSDTAPTIPPLPAITNQFRQNIRKSCLVLIQRVKSMSVKSILFAIFLVFLLTAGNLLQILMLNFWLQSFPSDGTPGNYTVFAIPGILFSFIFLLILVVYVIAKRPNLAFAMHVYGWGILTGIGFADAFNSWLATYAASHTSEVMQALFTNLCPLYSVFLSKWILHDPRRYLNWWIVSVFALTIAGILAVSLYSFIMESAHMVDGKWWILLFFSSIPFRVLINVWQSLYMIVYTKDEAFSQWLQQQHSDALEEGATAPHVGPPDEIMGVSDVPVKKEKMESVRKHERVTEALTPNSRRGPEDGDSLHDTIHSDVTANATPHAEALRWRRACDSGGDHSHNAEIQKNGRSSPTRRTVAHLLREECRSSATPSLLQSPLVRPTAHGLLTLSFFSHESVHVGDTMADMHHHTNELECVDDDVAMAAALTAEAGDGLEEEEAEEIIRHAVDLVITARYHQGEDTAVKLVMLAGETFLQLCFTLALLPADALPWFGNSATVSETWTNFLEGIRCVFTIKMNFVYGFLYTLGFVFSYIGGAYLNQYSVALCSIVTQLSSPFTALLLVIAPQLNVVAGGEAPWYCSLIAIVLLIVAAFVYVVWEEMTNAEKMEGEYELKKKKMQARPVRCDNIRIEED